jgi:hypothetical protein
VFVQWLQQYEITDELVAAVIRTLSESFSDFRVYFTNDSDLLILATPQGRLPPADERVFQIPELKEALERVHVLSTADLDIHQVGDRQSLMPLVDVLSPRTNSDFFPILSLEAPRARFEKSRARRFLELGVADLPLHEVLAGVPPIRPGSVAPNPDFSPAVLARRAAEISSSLREAAPSSDPAIQQRVSLIRESVGRCLKEDESSQVDALILLGGSTIPFLDSDGLAGVWSAPLWIGCTTQSKVVHAILAVLDAMARRDFASVETGAAALLEQHKEMLSPLARDWLLRAAMLAAIASYDYASVDFFDAGIGSDVFPNSTTELQRAYLLAYADAQLRAGAPERTALSGIAH